MRQVVLSRSSDIIGRTLEHCEASLGARLRPGRSAKGRCAHDRDNPGGVQGRSQRAAWRSRSSCRRGVRAKRAPAADPRLQRRSGRHPKHVSGRACDQEASAPRAFERNDAPLPSPGIPPIRRLTNGDPSTLFPITDILALADGVPRLLPFNAVSLISGHADFGRVALAPGLAPPTGIAIGDSWWINGRSIGV